MGWKIISIFLLSMFKFIAGPLGGYAAGLPYLFTVALTVTAMMTSVVIFTFLGNTIKRNVLDRYFQPKQKFSKRNRRFVTIWKKYGLKGVAFLTPVIFTPIGGTLLMTSMGTPRRKIMIFMLVSSIFWAFVFSGLIYTFGRKILPSFVSLADLHQGVFQFAV